jgi:hypothetical protein
MVNNLFFSLYFLWFFSSYSIFGLFHLIFFNSILNSFTLYMWKIVKIKKISLCDMTSFYTYEFHWNWEKYTEKTLLFNYISIFYFIFLRFNFLSLFFVLIIYYLLFKLLISFFYKFYRRVSYCYFWYQV